MCGRFHFSAEEAEEIKEIIRQTQERLSQMKTGEIYPTNAVPVLLPDGPPRVMDWGFPHFKGSGVIINARAETALEKPMFRDSLLSRRCVIPSTGFYEWAKKGREKTKYLFRRPGEKVLYMAGLYTLFKEEGGPKERFVILTTRANGSMLEDTGELSLFPVDVGEHKLIHHRMPVILGRRELAEWLAGEPEFEKVFNRQHILLEKAPA